MEEQMSVSEMLWDALAKCLGTVLAAICVGCREPIAQFAGFICLKAAIGLEIIGRWLIEKGGILLLSGRSFAMCDEGLCG
jgi:hypothetical protein